MLENLLKVEDAGGWWCTVALKSLRKTEFRKDH